MGLAKFRSSYLRDKSLRKVCVSNMEENLQLASCCAEQGCAREMITYLHDAGKFGGLDDSLVGNILDTYKKYGWHKELKNVKKTKGEQFDEKEAYYVLSLLTPKNYKKAINDFEFGWFFDPFGYVNVDAIELQLFQRRSSRRRFW